MRRCGVIAIRRRDIDGQLEPLVVVQLERPLGRERAGRARARQPELELHLAMATGSIDHHHIDPHVAPAAAVET